MIPNSQTLGVMPYAPTAGSELTIIIDKVTSIWPRSVVIQWHLVNAVALTGYEFTVHRSATPSGPWESVGSALSDIFLYVDTELTANHTKSTPSTFTLQSALYYKVTVTSPQGTASAVQSVDPFNDKRRALMARKLRRDAAVMLRKGSGTEIAILKKRWWGVPCTCVSKTGQVIRSKCQLCYGTGTVTGYWNPVYSYASRSVAPVSEQINSTGISETRRISAITLDIPKIINGDIIVFLRDNTRYTVDLVVPTELQTVRVHQELQLSELARSDNVYNISVDPWRVPPWF